MPYITTSNSKRLMATLSEITLDEIEVAIYKKDIYFFNKKERAMLKGIRSFLKDPEGFSTEYYRPLEIVDSLRFVYPESKPAYHKNDECLRLHSNFTNFEIPEEIRKKGKEEVLRFRNWFATNKDLMETDVKKFIETLQAKFMITREIHPKSVQHKNSGSEEIKSYNIEELESQIDGILREAARFFKENPDKQNVIRRFGKLTFLAYIHGDIYNNDSGLNDEDLKSFLRTYDEKFKKPTKELLIEYYRLLHNPSMTFSGTLLEKLNFRPCGSCLGNERDEIL